MQKSRIINWVRAQAKPYPGAFCFFGNKKIIVNKAENSNHGFSNFDENGLVKFVAEKYLIVKVTNGCIKLSNFYFEDLEVKYVGVNSILK